MFDAVIDALIVAGLEMQAVIGLLAAPKTAIKRIAPAKIDGAGNDAMLALR
jgi:hypothetical protein